MVKVGERLTQLEPVFVETISEEMEHGKIYVSRRYKVSIHLCACGCGEQVVLPFDTEKFPNLHWLFAEQGTFRPSVGNDQYACRSHYFITNWKIDWLPNFN